MPLGKSSPPSRAGLGLHAALATGLVLVAALRFVPFQVPYPLLPLEGLAFWALLPAYALAPIARWRGHPRTAAVLGLVALVHLGWTFEWLPWRESAEGATPLLRVLDANLLAPRPSEALADEILAADADVLALQEVSDEWLRLLDARGASERYPFRVAEPHPTSEDYFGIAILSRRPLEDARIERLAGIDFVPFARADVIVDGHTVRVYSIHTGPPASADWAAVYTTQIDWLVSRLRTDVASAEVLVAAGDFNASPYTFAHRRLRALGLTEAHEAAGRGLVTTWPNGVFHLPSMRLDHAYVHGAAVRSVRELPAHSSDHSPIVVDLGLEPS